MKQNLTKQNALTLRQITKCMPDISHLTICDYDDYGKSLESRYLIKYL